MPRTSRTVAQRLGTKQKSRRRASRSAPETPASVERILDEVAPLPGTESPAGAASATPPATSRPASGTLARRAFGTTRAAARPAPSRRRYAEYAAEYAYVWADLRRILLVAGALLLLLVVLSFVVG